MISEWSARRDTVFGREILGCEPWKYRPDGTRERGNFLDEICEILNNIKEPQFCVSQKSLRDHLNILESDATKREAERGSGTSSKYREIDQIMERGEGEETKARFKRRILHVPNLMQMSENNRFFSFALDSAHVKCDV